MPRLLTAGALTAVLATAGCGGDPAPEQPAAPAPQGSSAAAPEVVSGKPLITEAEVAALVSRITDDINKANAAQDPKLLDKYEVEASRATDGPSLATHSGGPIKPFTYEPQGSRVPSDTSGAKWFVADTQTPDGDNWPLIMTADGPGWKLAHAVPLQVTLPESKKDAAGNAEVVAADDPGRTLIASPADVAKAHAASIASEGAPSGLFAGDTATGEAVRKDDVLAVIKFTSGSRKVPGKNLEVAAKVEPYPVRALRTADGGALVAYTTRTDFSGELPGAKPAVKVSFLRLGRPGVGKLTLSTLHMWWVLVPAKGAGETVTVLGGTNQLVKLS
jgi:hypothetical protein